MFDAISPTYERVNRCVSFGRDAAWRKAAVSAARLRDGDIVLDICCGTGDMIRAFAAAASAPKLLIGVDFSREMLSCGEYDACPTPIRLIRADGLRLPVADGAVDVVSSAFGVRNFQDLDAGLREMRRVLRGGGRVIILEFALPENPILRLGYRLYCEKVMPLAAAMISRDKTGAYRYLPSSIKTFERRGAMLECLRLVGFERVRAKPMNLGGVVVYTGVRP